jgi:[ribosomal protein S5]-alanine N-acetyltransferase
VHPDPEGLRLRGDRIVLRFLTANDAESLLALHERNREFFRQFITTRPPDFHTLAAQQGEIERNLKGGEEGSRYSFGVFLAESGSDPATGSGTGRGQLRDTGELIGVVALTEVLRGPIQSCYIGYYLDKEHNGRGYATEAVRLAVAFAFDELKLHRLEAGVMPHNHASLRVLQKCGFRREGVARKSVEIDGVWQDHQMLAILAEDERPV